MSGCGRWLSGRPAPNLEFLPLRLAALLILEGDDWKEKEQLCLLFYGPDLDVNNVTRTLSLLYLLSTGGDETQSSVNP